MNTGMAALDNSSPQEDGSALNVTTDSPSTQRIKQEQLSIVNKYAKGPGSNKESDDESIYDKTDQYGFLHKSEPVPLSRPEEERRKLIEVKRRDKWLKMVRNWDKFMSTTKLTKRVYKGIPQGMRGDVWRLLLGVQRYMEQMPGVYKDMKTSAHTHSSDIRQIDLDVNRTYRDHIMFKIRYSIKQQELFHVLAAYSMYNTEVGYCQGMSQIAALLLMYMNEEEAFWALHSLLYGEKHRMHGFFIPGFPKLIRFQTHHDRILKKRLSKLKRHLDDNEVFASLYTMKWFFQCFLDRTPFSLTLRLWDIYMLEGERLLTAMSYTILKMHKTFIKSQDMDGIVGFLQEQLVKDFGESDDSVIEYLKNCMVELKNASLEYPPPPGEEELPKLPFGAYISSSMDKSPGSRIVPQFAKHSVDIATLIPDAKARDAKKKKRVKREKSNVGKSKAIINGLKPSEENTTAQVRKDHATNSRSPFLRRSSRKQSKFEKDKKKSEEKQIKTKSPEKSQGDLLKENTKQNMKHIKEGEVPINTKDFETIVNSSPEKIQNSNRVDHSIIEKTNGKTSPVNIGEEVSVTGLKTDHISSEREGEAEIRIAVSENNSNNLKTTPNNVYTSKKVSPTYVGKHLKSFIPPILSSEENGSVQHRATYSRASVENGVTRISVEQGGGRNQSHLTAAHNHSKSASDIKIKNNYVRSHSTDLLTTVSDYQLKKKAPSFSQLSAALDSLENLANSRNSSPSRNSYALSSATQSTRNRPQSVYDNVSPGDLESSFFYANPEEAIPESPVIGMFGSFEPSVEKVVSTTSSDGAVFTHHQSVIESNIVHCDDENKPVRRLSKDKARGKLKWRPVSMGSTVVPLYEGAPHEIELPETSYPPKANLGQEMRDKKRKKHHTRSRGIVPSSSMSQLEPSVDNIGGSCEKCKQPLGDHDFLPFQKAVEDSGIISSKVLMSRRMSREEAVTAALFSQMMREKKIRKRRGERKSLKSRSVPNDLSRWEADNGQPLITPVVVNKKKEIRAKSRKHTRPKSSNCEAYSENLLAKNQKASAEKVVVDRSPTKALNAESRGWRTTALDKMRDARVQSNDLLFLKSMNGESAEQSQLSNYGPTKEKLATDTCQDFPDNSIEREIHPNMVVIRYDVTTPIPQNWIGITRYPPDQNSQQLHMRRSPGLSPSMKADINELLSVGINANPDLIHRYDERLNFGYAQVGSPSDIYRPEVNRGRRKSSNVAIQTTESRL